jgi:MoaA/NifB/PqqE/SkfB family radical SAM enzyme
MSIDDKIILPDNYLKRLHIFLTTSCNLRCVMCSAKDKLDINPPIEIKKDNLIKLSDSIKHPIRFNFTGGEPLVYFNKNLDVLSHLAKNDKIHLMFITNGILLNDKIIDILANSKNGFTLAFSVDGYKKIYEDIRVGSSWDKIDDVIKNISQLTMGNKKNNIYVRYLLMNKTTDCYFDFVNYAVKNWDLSHIETDILLLNKDLDNKYLMMDDNDKLKFSKTIEMLKRDYNVDKDGTVFINNSVHEQIAEVSKGWIRNVKICNIPFYGMSIYYDGNVIPCCNSSNFCFGHIEKDNIYDIWNGKPIQEAREQILKKQKHFLCLCQDITLKKHKSFNEEKFKEPESRIATSVEQRKAYINSILSEYRNIHKANNNVEFLKNSKISPYDKFCVPLYSEIASMYLYRLEDFCQAEKFCDIILNIYPEHYETWMKKAIICFKNDNVQAAIDIMNNHIFSQNVDHALANFWMGYFYENVDSKKTEEAYNNFIQSDDVDKNSWGYKHSVGWLLKKKSFKSLNEIIESIKTNEKLKIVSFGCCLLLGNNSFNSYFVDSLKDALPDVEIEHSVFGMGSAVASSCFLRLDNDVISEDPDVVIINCLFSRPEKTLYDPTQYSDETFFIEAIIRKLIEFNPSVHIILVPVFSLKYDFYRYPQKMADYYNVCLIPTFSVLKQLSAIHDCDIEDMFSDHHTHFNHYGAKIFGEYLSNIFKSFITDKAHCSYPKLPDNKFFAKTFDNVEFLNGDVIKNACNWDFEVKKSFKTKCLESRLLFITTNVQDVLDISISGKDFVFWFGIKTKGVIYIEIDEKLYKYQLRIYNMQKELYEKGILFSFDTIVISCEGSVDQSRNIKLYMPDNQPIEDYRLEFWGIGNCQSQEMG